MKFRYISFVLFSALSIAATGCGKKERPAASKYEAAGHSNGYCTSSFVNKSNAIAVQARLLDAALDANDDAAALSAAKNLVKACDAFEAAFAPDASCTALVNGRVDTIRVSDKKPACDAVRDALRDTGHGLIFNVERDVMQFSRSL